MKRLFLWLLLFLAGNMLYAQNIDYFSPEYQAYRALYNMKSNRGQTINYQVALCNEKGEPLYPDSTRIDFCATFTDKNNIFIARSVFYGFSFNGVVSTSIDFHAASYLEAVHPLTMSVYKRDLETHRYEFISSQTLSSVPYAAFADNLRLVDCNGDVYMLTVIDGELHTVKMQNNARPIKSNGDTIRTKRFPYPEYGESAFPYNLKMDGAWKWVIRDEESYFNSFTEGSVPPLIDFNKHDLLILAYTDGYTLGVTDCYIIKKSDKEYLFRMEYDPGFGAMVTIVTYGFIIDKMPEDATVKFEVIDNRYKDLPIPQ